MVVNLMGKISTEGYILIAIGFASLVLVAYGTFYSGDTPEDKEEPIPITLSYSGIGEKYFFNELFNSTYKTNVDFISEVEIFKSPSGKNHTYGNNIELIVKFCSMSSEEEARARAFFVDPRGIIQYEYPPGITKSFSANIGKIDLNEKILYKISLDLEPSVIIDGEWKLNIILLNTNNEIISEVTKPVNVYSEIKTEQEDQNRIEKWIIGNIGLILLLLLLFLLLFIVVKKYGKSILELRIKKKVVSKNNIFNEFDTLVKLKLSQDELSDLFALIALDKYAKEINKNEKIQVEGHNKELNISRGTISINSINLFKTLINFECAEMDGNLIKITEKGTKFVKYLEDKGFVVDFFNDRIITKDYVSKFKKEKEKVVGEKK